MVMMVMVVCWWQGLCSILIMTHQVEVFLEKRINHLISYCRPCSRCDSSMMKLTLLCHSRVRTSLSSSWLLGANEPLQALLELRQNGKLNRSLAP
ncbi:hypothetical protein B0T17DRAFT_349174 [Bombardia bombarda]|uniref:Secreted protein n=1 Tax=Bombardia bombarda TaxID=252184 RepID=A0AA40BW18_9PEZI|nr:hypothetical protein B0T17DRAFT_349174 [Bombardia bombarda]